MFRLNAGYFLIQAASENDKEYVYKLIGENRRDDANGVPQTCFIGVIDPINPEVERPQDICDELMMAAQYIPANMLGVTDDCGFQPFSNDPRPNYGSPDIARDVAFKKITARLEGARMASEKLGV